MKRRGSILTEVLISILIFTVAIVGLAGSIMLSLRMVVRSGVVLKQEQDMLNAYTTYMLKRDIEHTGNPTASADFKVTTINTPSSLRLGVKDINIDVYKYSLKDAKKGSEIYVIQRNN